VLSYGEVMGFQIQNFLKQIPSLHLQQASNWEHVRLLHMRYMAWEVPMLVGSPK
jgi:hypothetical protein